MEISISAEKVYSDDRKSSIIKARRFRIEIEILKRTLSERKENRFKITLKSFKTRFDANFKYFKALRENCSETYK